MMMAKGKPASSTNLNSRESMRQRMDAARSNANVAVGRTDRKQKVLKEGRRFHSGPTETPNLETPNPNQTDSPHLVPLPRLFVTPGEMSGKQKNSIFWGTTLSLLAGAFVATGGIGQ